MRPLLITLLALSTAIAAEARDLKLSVKTESEGDFTVVYRDMANLSDYWCAAGKHVTGTLDLPTRTRIYRQSPQPPAEVGGIRFTLDASRSSGGTGFPTWGGPNNGSLTAGWAYQQSCNIRQGGRR